MLVERLQIDSKQQQATKKKKKNTSHNILITTEEAKHPIISKYLVMSVIKKTHRLANQNPKKTSSRDSPPALLVVPSSALDVPLEEKLTPSDTLLLHLLSPPVSIFHRKPLPAPLLLHSASMAPLTTSMADLDVLLPPIWLPPAEKGPPPHSLILGVASSSKWRDIILPMPSKIP